MHTRDCGSTPTLCVHSRKVYAQTPKKEINIEFIMLLTLKACMFSYAFSEKNNQVSDWKKSLWEARIYITLDFCFKTSVADVICAGYDIVDMRFLCQK